MDNQQQAGLNITQVGEGFSYLAWGIGILFAYLIYSNVKGRR